MPGVSSHSRARILEGLELKASCGEPDIAPVDKESLAIRRDEVGHLMALPDVPVQPQTAVHREDHSVASAKKLTVRRRDFVGHA